MANKRLAVIGSRDYPRLDLVREFVLEREKTTVIVSGGARGVDTAAVNAAIEAGLAHKVWEADWDKFGKSAGYKRNKQIVDDVDGLVAFYDLKSKGTAHSISLAVEKGIPYWVFGPDGEAVDIWETDSEKN